MKIRRRKPLRKTVCSHCVNYQTGDIIYKATGEGKQSKGSGRHCKVKFKRVDGDTAACRAFLRAEFFHCDKFIHRIPHKLCLTRRAKDHNTCKRCRQYGKEVKDIVTDEEHEYAFFKSKIQIARRKVKICRRNIPIKKRNHYIKHHHIKITRRRK